MRTGVKMIKLGVMLMVVFARSDSFSASGYHQRGSFRPSTPVVRACCNSDGCGRQYARRRNCHHERYNYDSHCIPGVTSAQGPTCVEGRVNNPGSQCNSMRDVYRCYGLIGGTLRLVFGVCFGDGHCPVVGSQSSADAEERSCQGVLVLE